MFNKKGLLLLVLLMVALVLASCSTAEELDIETPAVVMDEGSEDIILATTTSTRDSGLLDVLVPLFEEETGYMVKTIAVGTGAALEMGENGEADVLMTHAPTSEQVLVDSGVAIDYTLLMHNDFVLVGPAEDPANLVGFESASEGLASIAKSASLFMSRGDNSGTNKKELSLWAETGITPEGTWYQETGSGMGDTLNIAAEKGAYTMTDRATYLNLMDNLTDLPILLEKDPALNNIYHVMAINPEQFEKVNYEGAKAWIDFLVREDVQAVIGEFGVDRFNQPLFFPDAN